MRSFRVSSVVRAAPEAVWARATTIAGVNAELWPLARMTGEGDDPRRRARALVDPRGRRAADRLRRHLPRDASSPAAASASARGSARAAAWHHDRTLTALADGTRIVDEVAFTPRLEAAGGLLAFVFEAAFRWRHRRLRRIWR